MIGNILTLALVPASSTVRVPGSIMIGKDEHILISADMICGASLDSNPTVRVLTETENNNPDTDVYDSFNITYSAGARIKRSVPFDVVDGGALYIEIKNNSSADTITNVRITVKREKKVTAELIEGAIERALATLARGAV